MPRVIACELDKVGVTLGQRDELVQRLLFDGTATDAGGLDEHSSGLGRGQPLELVFILF